MEKLQNEINDIEEFSKTTENTKRKIVGRFIVLALTTYILLALGVYFYYHRISPHQKLIYTVPLIAVPVVYVQFYGYTFQFIDFCFSMYIIKRFLTWYYGRKIRKNHSKLVKLKEEKKKILETVEETETYKIAKDILEKFGDSSKKPILNKDSTPLTVAKSITNDPSVITSIPPGNYIHFICIFLVT